MTSPADFPSSPRPGGHVESDGSNSVSRCEWGNTSELMRTYHDDEWGTPVTDERKLFEYLVLDGFQAGLSWHIVLRKRESLAAAFRGFEPEAIAALTDEDVERLMADPGIIRNRAKIRGAIVNARALLKFREEVGSFADHVWAFTGGATLQNSWTAWDHIPAQTPESVSLSQDLKRRGFTFVGPTIIYAVMQSAGMVNDHTIDCFRHAELGGGVTQP